MRRTTTSEFWKRCQTGITLAACLLVVSRAQAAFESNDDSWQGGDAFYALARTVLGPERVKLVASLNYGQLTAADSLVIIHPMVPIDEPSLTAFIQSGGRVAILDDFGTADSFLERFGIRRLPAPTDPSIRFRDNAHLPVATPVESSSGPEGAQLHPMARDAERVILNHPTAFSNPGLTAIFEVRTEHGGAVPVAITGVVGSTHPGRLFAFSDPSAFMNLMLRFPGNRNFAAALVRYLAVDDGREHKGHLYIVANHFDETGHFGSNLGLLSEAQRSIERLLSDLKKGLSPTFLVLLAAITSIAAARWVYRHAFRRLSPAIPRFLRAIPVTAQAGWPGRAATLMGSSTHPAYVLLEMRAAFRQHLAQRVAIEPTAHSSALLALIEQHRLLDPQSLAKLRSFLAELDAIDQAVAARRPLRIRPATMSRLHHQGLDILDAFSQVEASRREPSLTY